jgi:hypothetical protein
MSAHAYYTGGLYLKEELLTQFTHQLTTAMLHSNSWLPSLSVVSTARRKADDISCWTAADKAPRSVVLCSVFQTSDLCFFTDL